MVAQKLQALLEEAGAITLLTRNSLEEHPTPGDRVIAGEKFGGEYFITMTHRKGTPYAAHYFLSQPGKKLAQAIANAMKRELKFKNVKVQEGLDFTIIQPSSTSVLINFGEGHLSKEDKRKSYRARSPVCLSGIGGIPQEAKLVMKLYLTIILKIC